MTTRSNHAAQDQAHLYEYGDVVISDGYITLQGKYSTEVEFFNEVKGFYKDIQIFLLPGVDYTAEDLCSEEYWAYLPTYRQRMAVLCLKHLTTLQDSSVHIVAPTPENSGACFRRN